MTMPRRRLVRPIPALPPAVQQRQLLKLREKLSHERAALLRWQKRLKRAFNTVAKCQTRIARIERQLARLEE